MSGKWPKGGGAVVWETWAHTPTPRGEHLWVCDGVGYCWGWASSAPVPSSRLDQMSLCCRRSASLWTSSRRRRASAGPMRSSSSGALQSRPPQRGSSRSGMIEPMSNVCTPKGMWCPGQGHQGQAWSHRPQGHRHRACRSAKPAQAPASCCGRSHANVYVRVEAPHGAEAEGHDGAHAHARSRRAQDGPRGERLADALSLRQSA
jgi:hypothetical protein